MLKNESKAEREESFKAQDKENQSYTNTAKIIKKVRGTQGYVDQFEAFRLIDNDRTDKERNRVKELLATVKTRLANDGCGLNPSQR